MRIRKLLCPTDLSNNSISGIAYALSLSRDQNAELILFHVTSFPKPPLSSVCEAELLQLHGRVFLPPPVDQLLREAHARVDAFVSASLKALLGGVRWRIRVSLGSVTREIVETALFEQVDLVVIAKRHRGILRRMLSASISEQVSRKAPCPVLSVCPPQIVGPLEGKLWPAMNKVWQSSEA